MSSQKEWLEESRDSWAESVRHDRKQFIASFVIAATGLTLAGVGIGTILKGDIADGAAELTVGAGLAVAFGKVGLGEVQDFADMTAQTAIRQSQIEQVAEYRS